MIKKIYNPEEVIDFAWELNQKDFYASYPRRTSRQDMKEVVERAIHSENRNIVACYQEDIVCGVCIYNWDSDENFAATEVFQIREEYEQIAEEFIRYISEQLPGHELLIGVPIHNKNANQYFKEKNIECISYSIDTRLYNLEPPMNQKQDKVEKIIERDFKEYALFHDKFAIPLEMYYTSKNLLKEIDRFQVFAFREGEKIHGSIFVKTLKDPRDKEVFGLFIDEEYKGKGIESILIHEMLQQLYNEFGALKEIVYFIDEDSTEELNAALAAGFQIKDQYRCYKCIL